MGDGVNIAARLEGLAKPGTIYLSRASVLAGQGAARSARSAISASITSSSSPSRCGSIRSKLASRRSRCRSSLPARKHGSMFVLLAGAIVGLIVIAVAAWYFRGATRTATVASNAPIATEAAHLSIVVLPFTNLSDDPSQDYFADGITENLTTDLSRIRNSFVIARNTAFTFKGRNVDTREIVGNLVFASCSKVRCSATRTGCASTPSSSTRHPPPRIPGRPVRGRRGRSVQGARSGRGAIGQYVQVTNSSRRKRKKAPVPKTRTPSI